ncbi:hypothetical protein BC938DRAFT_480809 [Jimgerdemannia flammicorona]|uniref:SnoaL-like domain-containing protein n=1 Tax=Jimgerdemannia flammicorona TaxID=994334 RepID=A0A433QHM3_9FUNG|nr:hypothetical protein BC938DRAFT_480809 [Jimgerdemannia flammicorona]
MQKVLLTFEKGTWEKNHPKAQTYVFRMNSNEKVVAQQCHAAIFSGDLRRQKEAIAEHYTVDAGRDKFLGIFRTAASTFGPLRADVLHITEEPRSSSRPTAYLFFDFLLTFHVLRALPITMRMLTVLEVNPRGQVVRHEDIFSIKDMLAAVPVLGPLYMGVARSVVSEVVGRVGEIFS